MPEHSNSFIVSGDINQIYDQASQYFISQGFSLKSGIKPTYLVFEKGTKRLGFTTDIKKIGQTLHVNISRDERGDIVVHCKYVFSIVTGALMITAGDKQKLDEEIMRLKNMIQTSLPQPAKQPTQTSMSDDERLQLLEDRFLKGEISEETYKELKKKFQ